MAASERQFPCVEGRRVGSCRLRPRLSCPEAAVENPARASRHRPNRRQVCRVVDTEAEPTARRVHIDVTGREDERQRCHGPLVAIDDVHKREGADPQCQREPARPSTIGPGHQADREPWPPELDERTADNEDRRKTGSQEDEVVGRRGRGRLGRRKTGSGRQSLPIFRITSFTCNAAVAISLRQKRQTKARQTRCVIDGAFPKPTDGAGGMVGQEPRRRKSDRRRFDTCRSVAWL